MSTRPQGQDQEERFSSNRLQTHRRWGELGDRPLQNPVITTHTMLPELSFLNKWFRIIPGHEKVLKSALLFAFVLIIGIALRSYQLGAESYWIDEWFTVTEGQQSAIQVLQSGRLDQPPAYYLPFRFWIQVFGVTEAGTRSFSVIAGSGAIVLMYLIGRELFSEGVGLLSAFLMAISEFQIIYSQQARYYTFFEFMTLLSFLFFIQACKSKRKIHFTLYVIASILMIYSHAFGIFILFGQNLYFVVQRKKSGNLVATWLICQALLLLAITPYFLPLFMGKGLVEETISNTVVTSRPSLWQPLHSVLRFFMPLRLEQSWGTMLAIYFSAAVFLGGSVGFHALRQGQHRWITAVREWIVNLKKPIDTRDQLLLLISSLASSILLPFVLSWLVIPIFYSHRYNIGAAPAVYLLLALGIFGLRKVVPLIISLSTLLILIVPGLHYYYVTDINQQWREASLYIAENLEVSEVIVFVPYAEYAGIELKRKLTAWYLNEDFQACGLDLQLPDSEVWNNLMQCISGHDRFWVIAFTDDPMIYRIKSFFFNPNQTSLRLLEERQFVELSVYLIESTR